MMKSVLLLLCLTASALAYVPTVESLLRHGSNPDVTVNGVALTLSVKAPGHGEGSAPVEEYFKLFFTKTSHNSMKVAQTRYSDSTFSEGSLVDKKTFAHFTATTLKGSAEDSEKAIFQGMLHSMIFNDGAMLLTYLKSLGVPVKLNGEIINRRKVELLASYKQYLVSINKDRTKKLTNPLKPDDAASREKVEQIMNESMYLDQEQVRLARLEGTLGWHIQAGPFEAMVSDKDRDLMKIRYKSQAGEFEVVCKDYWLANGTHSLPRTMQIKDFKGQLYTVEVTNLRHYSEKDVDGANRIKKWDDLLKGKPAAVGTPPFLL